MIILEQWIPLNSAPRLTAIVLVQYRRCTQWPQASHFPQLANWSTELWGKCFAHTALFCLILTSGSSEFQSLSQGFCFSAAPLGPAVYESFTVETRFASFFSFNIGPSSCFLFAAFFVFFELVSFLKCWIACSTSSSVMQRPYFSLLWHFLSVFKIVLPIL